MITRRVQLACLMLVLAALLWPRPEMVGPAEEPYPTPPIACCEVPLWDQTARPDAPTPFPDPVRGVYAGH